jgi:hypothetical protein
VAWHLPSDKVVEFTSESKSQVFWHFTNSFYLIGVGETEEIAVASLTSKVTDFTNWLTENHSELSVDGISSNLPEYRQAIYEFNTK